MWHLILIAVVVPETVFCQKMSLRSRNPCPSVLSYDEDTDGTLHATIVVPNDIKKVPKMKVGASYVGTFDNDTEPQLILDLPMKVDDLLKATELTYKLTFTRSDLVASITQIKFNGKVYCRGPSEPLNSAEFTEMWVYKEGTSPSVFCPEMALCIQTKPTTSSESLVDPSSTITPVQTESTTSPDTTPELTTLSPLATPEDRSESKGPESPCSPSGPVSPCKPSEPVSPCMPQRPAPPCMHQRPPWRPPYTTWRPSYTPGRPSYTPWRPSYTPWRPSYIPQEPPYRPWGPYGYERKRSGTIPDDTTSTYSYTTYAWKANTKMSTDIEI